MGIKTKWLLLCGAVGCPLFVIVFFIEGATRAGYDSFRHPVSSLAIGRYGWIQVTSFIVCGILLLAFALGLKQTLRIFRGKAREPLLMTLVATGLITSGFFSSDPVYGYPPNQPFILSQFSVHGNLHVLFSLLVFICLPLSCFCFRKRFTETGKPGWATYSLYSGIVMIATFIIAGIGFEQVLWFADFAGIFQRISIIAGWAWITLVAIHLIKAPLINFPKQQSGN